MNNPIVHKIYETLTPYNKIRLTTKERKEFLLKGVDCPYLYNGVIYDVRWQNLGSGVWEMWLVKNNSAYNKIFDDARVKND